MNTHVDLLHRLVSTPSFSREEGAVAELLVEHMSANGMDAHVDEAGNAVGLRCGGPAPDGAPQRSLVLLGHIDTVPGEVPVRIAGNRLYGRGSVDAKGSIATFVRAVAQVEPLPGVDLIVVGAVEEEAASSKGARYAATQYAPDACVIGEPSGWDAVTIGYKGCARLELEFTGEVGHSAGPLPPLAEAGAALWQGIHSWCVAFNADRARLFDQVLPTLQAFNTSTDGLHEQVHLRLGFRLPPEFDLATLERLVGALAPQAAARWSGHEVAWGSSATTPLARALRRSILVAGGRGTFKRKTGTSDMNVVGPVWGCPIVAYGPGDSSLDHTPDEHLDLAEYGRAITVLTQALTGGGWARESSVAGA